MRNSYSISQSKKRIWKKKFVTNQSTLYLKKSTILNKRNLVVGFNAMLHCAVKALPPAKITWFKNKMPLPDVGKYIQKDEIGVVQLELMRAKTGDTGTYTVVAENCHGKVKISFF